MKNGAIFRAVYMAVIVVACAVVALDMLVWRPL